MDYDFSKASILVFGDIMLDKFHKGVVRRISPEAPVPIVKVNKSYFTPGGAGNVANNIAHLHGNASLIGVVGRDLNRKILSDLLDKINVKSFLVETDHPTITKVRVIGEHQQIVRLDFEETITLEHSNIKQIIKHVNESLQCVNTVIISDYDKGVCTPELCDYIIKSAGEKNISVLVDPKCRDWNKFRGATIVKPNVRELSHACGIDIVNEDNEIEEYGRRILKEFGFKNILVTRSEKGMSLISGDDVLHFHSEAKEVFDVSGAGDTVIATLAVSIGSGLDLATSIHLANKASGIVVGKSGTAPIEYIELMTAQEGRNKKLVHSGQLKNLMNDLRYKGKKVVFTYGFFDSIQKWHISFLKQSKSRGDVLIVGIVSDESAGKHHGGRGTISNLEERMEVLTALELIDYVVLVDTAPPLNVIKEMMPDVVTLRQKQDGDAVLEKECAAKIKIERISKG
ncbi:MAG: D-beta-D-heptose 7-phosphate kinase / D-beta-D-heptose 1-phosphate adenosyltransferase [Nitrospirae bacterium]|nr:MAG: D-beta-D-heptose 7-phosphate kinase / D-beta-D-heptose 1-phosphate adenosyltransferase [Nitrospirota bacterium]